MCAGGCGQIHHSLRIGDNMPCAAARNHGHRVLHPFEEIERHVAQTLNLRVDFAQRGHRLLAFGDPFAIGGGAQFMLD
jgi:hypothetical protein